MDNSEHSCYLFTSKVAEPLLALSWQEDIFNNLGLRIPGKIDNLKDLFKELFIYSEENHFTLVIDEFQEIEKINKTFFSEFQNLWDTYKNKSKMNLIVCGSVYSLMVKIFENAKEPLFSRCNLKMTLKPLPPSVIKEILSDYYPKYTNEDLQKNSRKASNVIKLRLLGPLTKKDHLVILIMGWPFFLAIILTVYAFSLYHIQMH